MIEERPATQAEAYREMVVNMGQDRPDEQWILTPYDTWEKNPAYVGPDQPHPEDCVPDLGDDPRMFPGEENTQWYEAPVTQEEFERQFVEWRGDSREAGMGCD